MKKTLWQKIADSKTVRLNIITLIIGVIAMAQGMPQFQEFAPWLVFISGVLNLVLRIFYTSKPITDYASSQS